MRVGVILPSVDVQRELSLDVVAAARYVEGAGLDSVWHGDHLMTGEPILECTIALAAAAAATTHVQIGSSVFIPGIRPLAWAAKQVASLQYVADGRLVLGVGSGFGSDQWVAAGLPFGGRGARTDAALAALPALFRGGRVQLTTEPGSPEVELAPAVPAPPVWVGNASAVAIRRAAQYGDGWFPSLVSPDALTSGASRLAELAEEYRRPVSTITVGAAGALGSVPGLPSRREIAGGIADAYGVPLEDVMSVPLTGSLGEVAEQLDAYHEAGATHVVIGFVGGDWREQVDLLAEVRASLAA